MVHHSQASSSELVNRLTHRATVTKLPDAKPPKLVICYSPSGKKVPCKAIWMLKFWFHTYRQLDHKTEFILRLQQWLHL